MLGDKLKLENYNYIFYIANKSNHKKVNIESNLPQNYKLKIFKPKLFDVYPYGLKDKSFLFWWLMYFLNLFKNRHRYKVYVVYSDDKPVHYSVLLPWHYKYSFMDYNDIQIGPCFTDKHYRGTGLAKATINKIMLEELGANNNLWYITRSNNKASVKLIEKVGFNKTGEGYRRNILGIKLLGKFKINKYY